MTTGGMIGAVSDAVIGGMIGGMIGEMTAVTADGRSRVTVATARTITKTARREGTGIGADVTETIDVMTVTLSDLPVIAQMSMASVLMLLVF